MADRALICPTCARAHAASERFCEACGMPLVNPGGGEPEQAVNVARLAVPVAAQSGSARMRAELHALRQRMEPWRGGQPGRDLDDTLRALPRTGKAG